MMRIFPLYSSSSGNLYCLETDDNSNILIDCGVSYKAICDGLKSIDKHISDVSAILITHEHIDHIKGLPTLCKKNNIPIYTCSKTAEYLKNLLASNGTSGDIIEISYDTPFLIGKTQIVPFETSHDALEPCGFHIASGDKKLTIATDLGYLSEKNMEYLRLADYIILESNYDKAMLTYGIYPFNLKRRIASNFGHLSNDDSANAIVSLVRENDSLSFLLAHLSENNNMIDIAKQTIESVLLQNDIDASKISINFATKTLSNEVYDVC